MGVELKAGLGLSGRVGEPTSWRQAQSAPSPLWAGWVGGRAWGRAWGTAQASAPQAEKRTSIDLLSARPPPRPAASVANPAAIWHSIAEAVQSALPKRMRV